MLRRCSLLIALMGPALAAAAPADDVQVVRAWFDAGELEAVTPLLTHAQIERNKGFLRTDAGPALRAQLEAAGLRVEVDKEATEALHRLQRYMGGEKSIPGYACYRTVEESYASAQQLVTQYPALVSVQDIGPSWTAATQPGGGGYTLRVLKATNSAIPGPKPALFLIGSIHAREYTPAELLLRFVEELVQNHGIEGDATWILDRHEIHLVMQGNPDGRKRAETGLSWRKNVNNNYCPNSNSRGIDLNRNFPFEWGLHDGSSPVACDDTFRGPSPGSEPETQAMVNYVRSLYPDRRGPLLTDAAPSDTTGIFMDIHSYSQLVLWPWGFTETPAPNATALGVLGRRMGGFNRYKSEASVGLYPTDGTTDDFAYGELGVPAYTIELGTAFFENCDTFANIVAPPNRLALRYAARTLSAPYLTPAGPDATEVAILPDLAFVGDPVLVSARLDDATQQENLTDVSGPVPAVQPIASVDAYVGTAPWLAGATANAMAAADGSFNTPIERAQGTLPTTGLAAGKHLVYVQGTDTSGSTGPIGAAFIELIDASSGGRLTGRVSDVSTGAALEADVRTGTHRTRSSAGSGGYSQALLPGNYNATASARGYESATAPAFDIAAGQQATQDFALFRLCAVVNDTAEVGGSTPFTAQTPWTRRAGAGISASGAWLQSASGNYGNNLNTSLTSALLNLAGHTTTTLSFDQRCNTEAGWDFGRVEISTNGGSTWTQVFICDGETAWRSVELRLPQLDGAANARLRFRFTSDTNTTAAGWALDNIKLSTGNATCRASQQPPVAIQTFAAAPASIATGASSTLSWSSTGATACSISNTIGEPTLVLASGELANGSRSVSPASDVTYTLTCQGNGGPVSRQAAIDVVPPPVSIGGFSAAPATVVAGDASTLSWTTSNASACSIANSLDASVIPIGGGELAAGSAAVTPASSATYMLTCQGPAGPVSASASVTVQPRLAIAAFAADPASVLPGASTTLSWSSANASTCAISNDRDANVVTVPPAQLAAGAMTMSPGATTTYTLTCQGAGGPASAATTVTLLPPPADGLFSDGFE